MSLTVQGAKGKGKQKELDSPSTDQLPFADVLSALELASVTRALPPHVASFLSSHLAQLKAPQNPFPRNPDALKRLKAGKDLPGGNAEPTEQSLVEEVAERFQLDEVRALSAVRVALSTLDDAPSLNVAKRDTLSDEEWNALTAYVFEERMAVIGTVGLLLRCRDDETHPCHDLAVEIVPSILTPTFVSSLIAAFVHRTTNPLPDSIRASSTHSLFWAKQLIREQKALLEILFLVFYSVQPPDGPVLNELLTAILKTAWGQRQETFGYFDNETKGLVRELGHLLSILAVEGLNLEVAIEESHSVLPSPTDPRLPATSIFHPSQLTTLTASVEALVASDRVRSSPLLLGWAFLLSRITSALLDRPDDLHDAYRPLASLLQLDSPSPLFQLYASHALAPSSDIFTTLHGTLTSPLFAPGEPNAVGYISVLRAEVACLPLLVRLPFLSEPQYLGLVQVFAELYSHPGSAPLAVHFWSSVASEDEGKKDEPLVELARSRFPAQFRPLISLVRALIPTPVSAMDEDNSDAQNCARSATGFLGQLESLTHALAPSPTVALSPYEIVGYPDAVYKSTRPIPVSRRVTIPVGTIGRLVSEQGRKPLVIAWEYEWSAWSLLMDVLEDYAKVGRKPSGTVGDVFGGGADDVELPVKWETEEEQEEDLMVVLDLFRTTFVTDPALAAQLVEHMATAGRPTTTAKDFHFVEVLFRILERAMITRSTVPTKLVSAALGLVAALLPAFPGVIFTFLRSSTLLFPPTSPWNQDYQTRNALLSAEKVVGVYPVTKALLALVQALVLEDQVSEFAVEPAFEDVKRGVLVRALTWVRDEVWTAHSGWRFADLAEKYELGRKVVQLYLLVLEQAELTPVPPPSSSSPTPKPAKRSIPFDPVATVVLEALLIKPTVSLLSPLISTLAAGPDAILLLRKALRYSDAQAAEDLVEATLLLVRKLLRFRRRGVGPSPCLLERLCLSSSAQPDVLVTSASLQPRVHLLTSIARFIVAPVDPKTAVEAAKVLTLLCLGTSEWSPRSPSLGALLGGSEKVQRFITAMLGIASDPLAVESLQVAIWDLMSAIVESQASLAVLLVTGRHYPMTDDAPVATATTSGGAEASALALAKSRSLAPPALQPLPRTALGVGLETIGTWSESWNSSPMVLAAVLRFFDFAWQHLVDYGKALDDFRSRPAPWEAFVRIAFEPLADGPEGDEEVRAFCHRLMAKAHAVRIVALDIQAEITRKPRSEGSASSKELLKSLGSKRQLAMAMSVAIATACAPELHEGILGLIQETFPEIPLDALRLPPASHPLDDAREFGAGFIYSLPMLRRKVDGFMSDPTSMVDAESLDDVISQTAGLNLNFSLLEAQISNTRSWRQLFEIALPFIRRDVSASTAMSSVAPLIAGDIADENRTSQIIATVHEERLSVLLTMVEALDGVKTPIKDELVTLFADLGRIFASETLPPLESVARRLTPTFHRTLFRITYFAFRKLTADKAAFEAPQHLALSQATEVIVRIMITATRDLLVLAHTRKAREVEEDLALAVAVIGQVLRSPFAPLPSVWLAHCRTVDLFRSAFDVFVYMTQLDGRDLYAQHVLDLCLVLAAASPQAGEHMALDGLMTALTNNALSATAEVGAIAVTGPDGERTPQHAMWTSMLALVVSLTSSLGGSTQFVEQEVAGFVRLYSAQLSVAMGWNADAVLTLPLIEEMLNTVSLVYGVVRHAGVNPDVLAVLAEQSLYLLQQVVFAILHPNHLAGLIEPVTTEERVQLDKEEELARKDREDRRDKLDQSDKRTRLDKDVSGAELAERPLVASVTAALVHLARVLVDSLLSYTQAFAILTQDTSEWRTDRAIVIPSATVTSSEKASVGTLFDLADWCLDTLRQPAAAPQRPEPAPASWVSTLSPYSSELLRRDAEQTLEASVILATTQLAAWLYRPESAPARATAVMRREIKTELAAELLTKVGKSEKKRGGAKAKETAIEDGMSAELAGVLHAFIGAKIRDAQ